MSAFFSFDGSTIRITGPAIFSGPISLPANFFGDTQFNSADPLTSPKYVKRHVKYMAQDKGAAATAERKVVHVAEGTTGTVVSFTAGVTVTAVGAATVTLDLYKNGASILSGTFNITSSTTQFTVTVTGTITGASYVAGDVFEVVQTVAAGGGTLPQGVWARVVFNENP